MKIALEEEKKFLEAQYDGAKDLLKVNAKAFEELHTQGFN